MLKRRQSVSRSLLAKTIDEVKEYMNNGYRLLAVIGIDGSPSCGIHCSCSSKRWGGEISLIKDLEAVKQIDYCAFPGIFMEELQQLFKQNAVKTSFLAYKSHSIDALIEALQKKI